MLLLVGVAAAPVQLLKLLPGLVDRFLGLLLVFELGQVQSFKSRLVVGREYTTDIQVEILKILYNDLAKDIHELLD